MGCQVCAGSCTPLLCWHHMGWESSVITCNLELKSSFLEFRGVNYAGWCMYELVNSEFNNLPHLASKSKLFSNIDCKIWMEEPAWNDIKQVVANNCSPKYFEDAKRICIVEWLRAYTLEPDYLASISSSATSWVSNSKHLSVSISSYAK